MKALISFMLFCTYLAIVDGHGWLADPASRMIVPGSPSYHRGDWAQQWSLPTFGPFWQNTWFYGRFILRNGAEHICGSNGEANTEKPGPIAKTYTSGDTVLMTAQVPGCHYGAFNVRICKLENPTDIPTQACFDQNLIKITPVNPIVNLANKNIALDDYHFTTESFNERSTNFTFKAQLPPGLTCDRCVVLWNWRSPYGCSAENGTIDQYFKTGLNGWPCPGESRRTCSDISIVANPNAAPVVYKPNRFLPGPDEDKFPKVFLCLAPGVIDYYSWLPKPKNPDPYLFKGAGVACFIGRNRTGTAQTCEDCRLNCMSPSKTCPTNCFCRWFLRNSEAFPSHDGLGLIWEDNSLGTEGLRCKFNTDTGLVPITYTNLTSASDCRTKCQTTDRCSHYDWSTFSQPSKCILKFGMVQKTDAVFVPGSPTGTDVCGIVNGRVSSSAQIPGYLGCYQDGGDRDLSIIIEDQSKIMTREYCSTLCKLQNYKYAGLQNGWACLCGNSYGKYGKAFGCSSPCTGDSTQACGGFMINSIYDVSLVTKALPQIKSSYMGCFADDGNRDLPTIVLSGSSFVTVEYCSYLCYARNFSYVGLQFGVECWCGNSYGKYGQFPNDCNSKCSGNANQSCGGGLRNSIFSLNTNEKPTAIGSTRGIGCEWQDLKLKCPQGQNLNIVSANWGRTDAKMCGNFNSNYNTNCKSDKAEDLKKLCNNNNSCVVNASVVKFGDPCVWVSKYLDVQYTCA